MRHHTQKAILDVLAGNQSLRYSQIKPDSLDGNVFGYHLKQLIRDKLVTQNDDGDYTLTRLGRDFIVHRDEDSSRSAHSVFFAVVKSSQGYLLRRRLVQPLLGWSGFLHGEPTPGQAIIETAKQRIYAKTGLDVDVTVCGSALITQSANQELQSFTNAIIVTGQTSGEITKLRDETGENYWSRSLTDEVQLLPSCHDIINMIEAGPAWFEKSYQLEADSLPPAS